MSQNDICITCRHPRRRHRDGTGICICDCNMFRGEPPKAPVCDDCPDWAADFAPADFPRVEESIEAADSEPTRDGPFEYRAPHQSSEFRYYVEKHCRHISPEFISAMDAIFEAGVKGDRVALDWQDLPPTEASKKLKNLLVHLAADEFDSAACNALILWWHFQRGRDAPAQG